MNPVRFVWILPFSFIFLPFCIVDPKFLNNMDSAMLINAAKIICESESLISTEQLRDIEYIKTNSPSVLRLASLIRSKALDKLILSVRDKNQADISTALQVGEFPFLLLIIVNEFKRSLKKTSRNNFKIIGKHLHVHCSCTVYITSIELWVFKIYVLNILNEKLFCWSSLELGEMLICVMCHFYVFIGCWSFLICLIIWCW